ncbi:MAG: hypothetical protein DMG53_20530 [Acidobacteria bacterium]|nr:MAG: hypothetical protein DMG53_20530 [Acidobacteriota bacterium]
MPYLVRLADRALRDIEAIYEFIQADASERAAAWFNGFAEEIYSLERFPERGAVIDFIPELKTVGNGLGWIEDAEQETGDRVFRHSKAKGQAGHSGEANRRRGNLEGPARSKCLEVVKRWRSRVKQR